MFLYSWKMFLLSLFLSWYLSSFLPRSFKKYVCFKFFMHKKWIHSMRYTILYLQSEWGTNGRGHKGQRVRKRMWEEKRGRGKRQSIFPFCFHYKFINKTQAELKKYFMISTREWIKTQKYIQVQQNEALYFSLSFFLSPSLDHNAAEKDETTRKIKSNWSWSLQVSPS